jgi:hypothetical protein
MRSGKPRQHKSAMFGAIQIGRRGFGRTSPIQVVWSLKIFYPLLRLRSNAICGCGRSRKFFRQWWCNYHGIFFTWYLFCCMAFCFKASWLFALRSLRAAIARVEGLKWVFSHRSLFAHLWASDRRGGVWGLGLGWGSIVSVEFGNMECGRFLFYSVTI